MKSPKGGGRSTLSKSADQRRHATNAAGRPWSGRRRRGGKVDVEADEFFVEGLAAVSEYLRFKPAALREIKYKPGEERRLEPLLASLGSSGPKLIPMARDAGDVDGRRTAPVEALVRVDLRGEADLAAALEQSAAPAVLALDHITDPRNLGAIVRSAAFFGVRHIIVPSRRQVLLTQASVATAQGGFALVDLYAVVNLGRTLTELKKHGYWALGADMGGEAFTAVLADYDKIILVLGAEDVGLSHSVRRKCDRLVSIPGSPGGLESLNVSVAAGILLSGLRSLQTK